MVDQDGPAALSDLSVIFVDVFMPSMTGIELAKELTALYKKNGVRLPPLIACTANDDRVVEQNCKSAGILAVLRKPFSQDDVGDVLVQFGVPKQGMS